MVILSFLLGNGTVFVITHDAVSNNFLIS